MAAVAKPAPPLTVALLGRSDNARDSLRRSLEELGAEVVFEGDPAGIEPAQVLQQSPRVVVVNLASGVEDDIDHLQSVFDDPAVNVVFNEADVSSQLAGWDLARWARHLASKITGNAVTNPPPPPGAELMPSNSYMPVPGAPRTPAQMAPERAIEEFMIEAEDLADEVPTDHLPMAQSGAKEVVEEIDASIDFDLGQVEGAMVGDESRPALEQTAVPEPDAPSIVVLEDEAAEFDAALDLDALDEALAMSAKPSEPSGKSDRDLLNEALSGLDLDVIDDLGTDDDESDADAGLTLTQSDSDIAEFSLEGFDDDENDAAPDAKPGSQGASPADEPGAGFDHEPAGDMLLDDDVAALAANLDAFEASARSDQAVTELRFDDSLELEDDEPSALSTTNDDVGDTRIASRTADSDAAQKPGSPEKSIFDRLELALLDEDDVSTSTPAAPASAAPAYDFSGLDMSLEPTEEEVEALRNAPEASVAVQPQSQALDESMDALLAAMDLAPSNGTQGTSELAPGEIPRVLVLGASIGGPDAVRTFLSALPKGFPALIVLVQHLENGFFERLAQQLQKSTKLPVRVPDMERPAVAGEVLVVSAEHRMRIESDGVITLVDHTASPKYTPCIDDVLRDVADEFGSKATAIIFSGMAGDAIEGAVYLTTMGGEVWAQDPTSCVVSSMVDGAQSRGVVEFVGSPRDLAERCIAKFGRT